MNRAYWVGCCLLSICSLSAVGVENSPAADAPKILQRDRQLLEKLGIDTTPQGVLKYLRSCIPKTYTPEQARALVAALGDDSFAEREKAWQELIHCLKFPRELLLSATESDDLEVRWRALLILEQRGKLDWRGFHAALRRVTHDPPPGTLETVVELAANYLEDYHIAVFDQVLPTLMHEQNAPWVLSLRNDPQEAKRWIAAKLLLPTHPTEARAALLQLSEGSAQSRFTLLAAKMLANQGERAALASLVRLVGSSDRAISEDSASFLQSLTQHEFPWPVANPQARDQQLTQLQTWLNSEGARVTLHFPVADSVVQRGNLSGNTLISTGGKGLITELTPDGKSVWAYASNAWSAEKMKNGNYLIASYNSNQVLEVDAAGKIVWQLDGVNAMRAKPLADEHVLIACFSAKRVYELDENHKEVWEHTTPENCFDAERLSNGNTVFACPNLICEITPAGEVVRSLEVKGRVNSVQIIPGGNWLVANYELSEVQLYNRLGEKIWHVAERHPSDAFRLRNGNTLITSEQRCIEVDRDGKLIRLIQETNYGSARQ
jgi:PQQ-like domain